MDQRRQETSPQMSEPWPAARFDATVASVSHQVRRLRVIETHAATVTHTCSGARTHKRLQTPNVRSHALGHTHTHTHIHTCTHARAHAHTHTRTRHSYVQSAPCDRDSDKHRQRTWSGFEAAQWTLAAERCSIAATCNTATTAMKTCVKRYSTQFWGRGPGIDGSERSS